MLVFISWSGQRSQAVATALRYWLPQVIQALDPWMSEEDIDSGARSLDEIDAHLEQASFGVAVVTRENVGAPWINFEAGAVAKKVMRTRVVAYLLGGMTEGEVRGPLGKFQHEQATPEGTLKLLKSLNKAVASANERALTDAQLEKAFKQNWEELHEKIEDALNVEVVEPKPPDQVAMLEEILGVVRALERRLAPRSGSGFGTAFDALVLDAPLSPAQEAFMVEFRKHLADKPTALVDALRKARKLRGGDDDGGSSSPSSSS